MFFLSLNYSLFSIYRKDFQSYYFSQRMILLLPDIISYPREYFEYMLEITVITSPGEWETALIWTENAQLTEVFILTITSWKLILKILINYIAFWHSLGNLDLTQKLLIQLQWEC